MSISIAGRIVTVGDPLYNTAMRAWGTVSGYDGLSAVLTITGNDGASRTLYVQQGGYVNNLRVIYWHEPLVLDLPFQNITKYQQVLNSLVTEFPS